MPVYFLLKIDYILKSVMDSCCCSWAYLFVDRSCWGPQLLFSPRWIKIQIWRRVCFLFPMTVSFFFVLHKHPCHFCFWVWRAKEFITETIITLLSFFSSASHTNRGMLELDSETRSSAWEQMNLIYSQTLSGCCSALFLLLVVESFALQDSLPRISNMLENVGASATACSPRKLSHWNRSRYTSGCQPRAQWSEER